MKQFVEDKSYHEAGGDDMERAHEKKYGEKVLSCRPKFDGKPSSDDLDKVKSEVEADADAAVAYAEAAPYPDTREVDMHVYAPSAA